MEVRFNCFGVFHRHMHFGLMFASSPWQGWLW